MRIPRLPRSRKGCTRVARSVLCSSLRTGRRPEASEGTLEVLQRNQESSSKTERSDGFAAALTESSLHERVSHIATFALRRTMRPGSLLALPLTSPYTQRGSCVDTDA